MMLRQSQKGGRPIQPGKYPLAWDKDKRMGYKIGYCQNCNNPQIMDFDDCYQMLDEITTQTSEAVQALRKLKPPLSRRIKNWIVEKLKESN